MDVYMRFAWWLDAYLYVFASAGTCSTDRFNREAFDKWRIVPRMLRDCTQRNTEVRSINFPAYIQSLIIVTYDRRLSSVQSSSHPSSSHLSAYKASCTRMASSVPRAQPPRWVCL